MQNSKGGLGSKEVHSARLVWRKYSLGIDGGGAGRISAEQRRLGCLVRLAAAYPARKNTGDSQSAAQSALRHTRYGIHAT